MHIKYSHQTIHKLLASSPAQTQTLALPLTLVFGILLARPITTDFNYNFVGCHQNVVFTFILELRHSRWLLMQTWN